MLHLLKAWLLNALEIVQNRDMQTYSNKISCIQWERETSRVNERLCSS